MKKIFLILIAINIFTTIYAQDKEPIQHKFYFPAYSEIDSVYLSDTLEFFKQDKFMFGWHWGGSKKISRSLNMNQKDISSKDFFEYEDIDSSVYLIVKSVRDYAPDYKMFYTHCDNKAQLVHAKAIQYEPTLKINSANMSAPDTNNYDGTNPVFGFKGVRGRVENDTLDHRSRLVLDSAGLNGQVVLDEPWLGGCLFRHDKGINPNNTENKEFLGYEWYITINLRRYDWDIYYDTSNVLKIEMPYILGMNGDSSLIVFDSIPYPYPFTTTLPNNRGKAQRLDSNRNRTNYFYIKRSMLPFYSENITISARFKLDNDIYQNPKLKDGMVTYLNNVIDTLKIRVTYYNNCNVAIDWIRIETPNAQRYFRGFYDNAITSSLQIDLKDFSDKRKFTNRGIKFFRFNSFIESSYQDWAAERYFNKLVGNVNSSENYKCLLSKHFEHYIKPPERWLGMYAFNNVTAVPYCQETNILHGRPEKSYLTMGICFGREGCSDNKDSLNSEYELWLNGDISIDSILSMNESQYSSILNTYQCSLQKKLERMIYEFYAGPNSGFLFSDKFWWSQNFILNHLHWGIVSINGTDTVFSKIFSSHRPQTGEEARYCAWNSLIMGAKGLFYDGPDYVYKDPINVPMLEYYTQTRLQHYNYTRLHNGAYFENMTAMQFLDSNLPLIGGDFLSSTYEADDIYNKFVDKEQIAQYMGTDTTRFYIGRRSQRLELKKIHDQIRRCEDELMELRLVAWFGKGYREWYKQNSIYCEPYPIINKFLSCTGNKIDTSRFKTRPCGRRKVVIDPPNSSLPGWHYEPFYEPWDSTFIDFTLLKNVDTLIEDVFYVGIQNRRTSPLIFYQDTVLSGEQPAPYLRFLSTAEFDDSCNASKNPTGYTRMRNYFWLKQGAREITLPFNYRNTNNADEYALLHITELGADTAYDDNWSFSRQQTYLQKIDTVIGQDKSITFNLMPGEGKIFKVEVLHPPTNVIGELYHSNQSKLVSYPVIRPDGTESDSVRYHLVYHRETTFPDSFIGNAVYYRRSKIVSKDCMEENINWENEIMVSDSINDIQNPYISCDYPSIVVRKDTDTLKAYIVYSCFKSPTLGKIVETILSVNDSIVLDKRGNELSEYSGIDRADWGNPVVNASGNGNYYAWSDLNLGIVAAWKEPNQIAFQASNKINFKYQGDEPGADAQHPSLNVYSHLDSLEDNCALVWQETPSVFSIYTYRILYTRLRDSANVLRKYLSPIFLNDTSVYGINNNIAQIGSSGFNSIYRYPVVNRGLGYYKKTHSIFCRRIDLIYWEAFEDNYTPQNNYLLSVFVWNQDTNNIPIRWNISQSNYIKSFYKCIALPNITQAFFHSYNNLTNDYTALNFKYFSEVDEQEVGHFNYFDYSYVSQGLSDSTDYNYLWVKFIGSGTLPHLSKNKQPLIESLWQNRRVYNNIDNDTNFILSSAKYFYKGRSDEMLADWYIGFETADSSKKSFLFGAPELDERRFSLKLPFEKVVSDEGYISFVETSSDTIASSWFSIEDAKELALKLKGSNNANSRVYIQNKETERTLRLNLPNGLKENKGAKAKYNLINGLGNEFRLLFVKNDEAMQYTEELWIEGLPIEEKPAGSFKGNDGIENIDLIQIVNRYYSDNDISIFPNPALEVLYLQTNVPYEEANLTVTNLLGTKVIQQQINLRSSPELKLDISFLLPGIYYVNISDGLSSISGKFLKR